MNLPLGQGAQPSHPYNWWFSGVLWYCNIRVFGKGRVVRVSGAGHTKFEAECDAKQAMNRLIDRAQEE